MALSYWATHGIINDGVLKARQTLLERLKNAPIVDLDQAVGVGP